MAEIETVEEALRQWDEGGMVSTIEMGGMGPGYEQAIHVTVFELLRELLGKELPKNEETLQSLFDEATHTVCKKGDLGLSGAQAAAAQQVVYRAMKYGWAGMLKDAPSDRRIMVSNHWPKVS